jgi:hypothetical protein
MMRVVQSAVLHAVVVRTTRRLSDTAACSICTITYRRHISAIFVEAMLIVPGFTGPLLYSTLIACGSSCCSCCLSS